MNNETDQMVRGFWSTLVVSIIGSPVAGYIWIGRNKLAILYTLAGILFVGTIWLVIGTDNFFQKIYAYILSQELIFTLLSGAISAAVVLPFRRKSFISGKMAKWYIGAPVAIGVSIGLSLTIALFVRTLLVQTFSIPSGAMVPTLQEGDQLWASKSEYGYSRFSLPFGMSLPYGKVGGASPERGDVVIFSNQDGIVYVFRVIGLPGETIQMIQGRPHVNGIALKHSSPEKSIDPDSGNEAEMIIETTPEGRSYKIMNLSSDTFADDTNLFSIPQGEYFVLGDNRDNSADSRFGIGMIPEDAIFAKPISIYANANGTPFIERKTIN